MSSMLKKRTEAARVYSDLGGGGPRVQSSIIGGKVRPHAGITDALDYDHARDDPSLVDDVYEQVMDSLESNWQQSHDQGFTLSRAEIERDERFEHQLLQALPRAVSDRLAGTSIVATRAVRDGTGEGYVLYARDSAGRGYEAAFSLEEMDRLCNEHGSNMGRALGALLAKKLVEARQHYFSRMQ